MDAPSAKLPSRRPPIVLPLVVGGLFLLATAGVVIGMMMPSTHDYDPLVLGRLNACPQAVELLGQPVTNQVWGMGGGGTMRLRGAFGEVDWTDQVEGPKGRGRYHYVLEKRGGPWTLLAATLSVGSTKIDLMRCSPGNATPR